jgi:8-oxo-dGTP pyrophosphatase MutT (NUDIX family)
MKKEILPAVSAIIFNSRGEILLQQRRDTGKWCVISGHVEFGESVQDAIVREIREETNVNSKVLRLIGVYSDPKYTTYFYPERTVQYVVTYFEVKLLENIDANLSNSETLRFEYFSPENLPPLDLVNPNWLLDALDDTLHAFIR